MSCTPGRVTGFRARTMEKQMKGVTRSATRKLRRSVKEWKISGKRKTK